MFGLRNSQSDKVFLSTALERFAPIRLSTLQDLISSLEIYPQYSGLLTETDPSLAPSVRSQSRCSRAITLRDRCFGSLKYRNVSGYLVVTSSRHTVCIDPGEGPCNYWNGRPGAYRFQTWLLACLLLALHIVMLIIILDYPRWFTGICSKSCASQLKVTQKNYIL